MRHKTTKLGILAGTFALSTAGAFALILFLLDRALYRLLALTGSCTARAAQRLHRGLV